jgi:D-cysteine desulfhydrase
VSKTEGIFLDPIYTGKAMAAMLDLIEKKKYRRAQNLLFWNTSSSPIFFAFDDYLS